MSYIAEKADFQRDFPPEKKLLSLLITLSAKFCHSDVWSK